MISELTENKVQVTTSIKTITPEIAGIYLSRNTKNRNFKRSNLSYIKNMMNRDLFVSLNGESIIIGKDGTLLNGQHRLKALFDLNKTYDFVVVEGVDNSAFTTMDIGVKRSTGDMFEVEKVKNARNVAAAMKFYMIMRSNNTAFKKNTAKNLNITNDELISTYKANESLFDVLMSHAMNFWSKMRVLPLSHVGGMMFYTVLHSEYGDNALQDFWLPLFNGANASPQILLLRNRLIEEMGKTNREKEAYKELSWVIQTYNAHFTQKELKILRYSQESEFPKFL